MYSKNNCPECNKAVTLLNNFEIPYEIKKVDEEPKYREFLVGEGHRAVPQFYIDGVLLPGGYNNLSKMTKDEILNKLQ